MSKADDMFKELGYEFADIDFDIEFHRLEYRKETQLENGIRKQVIWFDLNNKELYIHNSITTQELQAINKKVSELGWRKDRKDYFHKYYLEKLKPKRGVVR